MVGRITGILPYKDKLGESMKEIVKGLLLRILIVIGIGVMAFGKCLASEIDLPDGGTLQAQDTIPLKEFKAIAYIICDSEGNRWGIENVLIIYKDDKDVITIDEGYASISNICALMTPEYAGYAEVPKYRPNGARKPYSYEKKSDTCYIGDINGDSIDEIIINIFTGGANCCFTTRVYAVKDSLEELLNFNMIAQACDFIDIDSDSILEVLTWDNSWTGWRSDYTSWKAYIPPLILRWDKRRYRVANLKFADYLVKLNKLDSYVIPPKDSSGFEQECSEYALWSFIINNYYAGRADLADSLFNACWRAQDTMKLKIYQEFQQRLRQSEYWPQVLESKW
jgi:hypothetical protein